MPKRADLLQMTPEQVWDSASHNGLWRAMKRESFAGIPDAVARWYKGRPEYNHPTVKDLINQGQQIEADRIAPLLERLAEKRRVAVFTLA